MVCNQATAALLFYRKNKVTETAAVKNGKLKIDAFLLLIDN